jgi:Protein of unknown function (DUF2971)
MRIFYRKIDDNDKSMKLYKYRSLKNLQYVLDVILLERLYCAPYTELNDPCEGLFFSSQSIGVNSKSGFYFLPSRTVKKVTDLHCTLKNSDSPRICSLSNTLSDVRLWSYYADSHKGVAIEIDFSGIESDVNKIKYLPQLQEHRIGTFLSEGSSTEEVLLNKTVHWEYEEEYRIIQGAQYYPIIGRITNIYLGINSNCYHDILKKVIPSSIPLINTKICHHNLTIEPSY